MSTTLEDVLAFVAEVERPVDELVQLGTAVAAALRSQGRDAVFDAEVAAVEAEADAREETKLKGE
jgi:hypothetical protein